MTIPPRGPNEQGKGADGAGADGQVRAPSVQLPKGGGAIRGVGEKFAANPVTGTASMTVPIATSPGRSGFGPQLSLSYDSGSGNGPFGFGWSLSLPAIARKTDKGLPRYQDAEESDVYILSGAEDLVPVLNSDGTRFEDSVTVAHYTIHRYRPRIEGLFARIERWTHRDTGRIHWRSITRDNVTTLYGEVADSTIFAPHNPQQVFTWLISQSYDDKGNVVVYEYVRENGEKVDLLQASERNRTRGTNLYLKRIKYGNQVSRLIQPDLTQMQWMFEVVFDYDEGHYKELDLAPGRPEEKQHRFVQASPSPGRPWEVRPDPFSSHRAGFEIRTYRRCRRVLMFHHFAELGDEPCLVRSTEFEYADLDYKQPVEVDTELAHQGSTRFASFIRAVTQSGFVRDETRPLVEHNGVKYATYLKKSLPPIEFEYSKASIQDDVRELDADSLRNLPVGLDGAVYQWVDVDGEGVTGILTEQANGWYYKRNLGQGRFGALETIPATPSLASLSSGRQQLLDLAGDGQLDLATFAAPTPGFYERTHDRSWEPYRPFASLPSIPWDDPNLRFLDLSGDGHADVLITEQDVFTWHQSLAEAGFGPARKVRQPSDDESGPRLVFGDRTQTIYLADMCGDGLTDLVRIRNGQVCYWPNLGYGRFGAKVTMDDAPRMDNPDQFEQRRVRLADIDGSGVTDIIYLGRDGVRLYFNQSGNGWTGPRHLPQLPLQNDVSSVITADLLGNGTACLVWSSPLPGDMCRPARYVDLMGGKKPHLLIKTANNLGAETRVHYAPSTRFYLADRAAGKPWITRLPFP
ncbi:MAG: toxin, partial [Chloroflexota bacterium]|nr:toxin [Chloroflexota bacterium]